MEFQHNEVRRDVICDAIPEIVRTEINNLIKRSADVTSANLLIGNFKNEIASCWSETEVTAEVSAFFSDLNGLLLQLSVFPDEDVSDYLCIIGLMEVPDNSGIIIPVIRLPDERVFISDTECADRISNISIIREN